MSENNVIRNGCKDIWNAFMVKGANFSANDIPYCSTENTEIPKALITWDEAKTIYNKHIKNHETDFKDSSYVCFYLDDYKFDGIKGIWNNPYDALRILLHFGGIVTPDFSTNQDFPKPIKIYNTYRMRAFGYWIGKNYIPVINNVRWGTAETYSYCFDGLPRNSILCVGTVGGNPKRLIDRSRFINGLNELVRRLNPHTILTYGSANYPCFDELKEKISVLFLIKAKPLELSKKVMKMSKGNSGYFEGTSGKAKALIDEVIGNGDKITPDKVVGITKNQEGKIIWLEEGNHSAGLQHIVKRHGKEFNAKGITEEEIPKFILTGITKGVKIGTQGKRNPREIYMFEYNGEIHKAAIQISKNGFIVSANLKKEVNR